MVGNRGADGIHDAGFIDAFNAGFDGFGDGFIDVDDRAVLREIDAGVGGIVFDEGFAGVGTRDFTRNIQNRAEFTFEVDAGLAGAIALEFDGDGRNVFVNLLIGLIREHLLVHIFRADF